MDTAIPVQPSATPSCCVYIVKLHRCIDLKLWVLVSRLFNETRSGLSLKKSLVYISGKPKSEHYSRMESRTDDYRPVNITRLYTERSIISVERVHYVNVTIRTAAITDDYAGQCAQLRLWIYWLNDGCITVRLADTADIHGNYYKSFLYCSNKPRSEPCIVSLCIFHCGLHPVFLNRLSNFMHKA